MGAGGPPSSWWRTSAGFTRTTKAGGFREVALGLHRLGYRMACFVLHGADFVPQSRSRIYFVGVAEGVPVPEIEVTLGWERRARPAKLALLMNDLDLPWLTVVPPPPPPRQDRLADIVDLDGDGWWPEERVRCHLGKMTKTTRGRLSQLLATDEFHVAGLSWNSKGWGTQFNGLAPCLLASTHGSSYHLLVVTERERVRMRRFSVAECGLLMGSSGDWTRFPREHARIGLGDGVVVPAVRWIDRHILTPIAQGILAAPAAASPLHRRCPVGAPADLRKGR